MRTSVNLRNIDLPKIADACEKTELGHSKLICRCLMRLFSSHPDRLKVSLIGRLVEYQPDFVGYKIVNVDLDVDVYNLGVNFRVFSRLSVSMMVTIALELFLDQVVQEIEGGIIFPHNYIEYSHHMRHNSIKNAQKWNVVWNIEKMTVP